MSKVRINFSQKKIYKQLENKSRKAIVGLKGEIVRTTDPYVPLDKGQLKKSALPSVYSPNNLIIWNTPYARFVYHGMLMVDAETGSVRSKKNGEKKVTSTKLNYHSGDSKRKEKWFERSKVANQSKWTKFFERILKFYGQ
ncbi:hypothetical protein EII25_03360 [Erysipelotrichaceae bacterium OH741_COT-311]|nr:hypothetical protein EII25_03360 [Erysipelotrichaceae bacterium OH741_COT-311]